MTATERDDPGILYGDEEAEQASGLPLPSMRVLQAAGGIRSHKVAKEHGGYRRMWSESDVLKASIAAALGEHFAWNVRVAAALMATVGSSRWDTLIVAALAGLRERQPGELERHHRAGHPRDCSISVFDRKYVVLDGDFLNKHYLLGVVVNNRFISNRALYDVFGEEYSLKIARNYLLAIDDGFRNFISEARINLSMQVRKTWRRLQRLNKKSNSKEAT